MKTRKFNEKEIGLFKRILAGEVKGSHWEYSIRDFNALMKIIREIATKE